LRLERYTRARAKMRMIGSSRASICAGVAMISIVSACSNFYMNFTSPLIKLSGRTMDLGSTDNWTITSWPVGTSWESPSPTGSDSRSWKSIYGAVGITGNWIGDDKYLFPHLFGDSINDQGLSCGLLTLVGTIYQPFDPKGDSVMYGLFCQWATGLFTNVMEVKDALADISVWGPPIMGEHFVLHDATGATLVVEFLNGQQNVYLDLNDGVTGYGIMTNEPTFDWHLINIEHYEWKRTLSRQAIAIPGGFYPEERFLRVYMIREGMDDEDYNLITDYQQAFSLTAQVLNSVTVPMGKQYGTDTGKASGEGNSNDHTIWGLIRDHQTPTLYWRDSGNPTFRRLRLQDLDLSEGAAPLSMLVEVGPYFIDMSEQMK